MNAFSHPRRSGLLAAALARAEAWLLEPPRPGAAPPAPPSPSRPVVVVRGLARGCGASTVARALAASLARGDPAGAAVVIGGPGGGGPRIPAPAAVRMARALADAGCDGARASGRVCVVADCDPLAVVVARAEAPVVVDVAHASPPAQGLGHADVIVLVGSPAVEESLLGTVETSLAGAGHLVEVVVNRVEPDDLPPARGAARLLVGESRLAAQLALACREARGPFATPIAELAERCRAAVR